MWYERKSRGGHRRTSSRGGQHENSDCSSGDAPEWMRTSLAASSSGLNLDVAMEERANTLIQEACELMVDCCHHSASRKLEEIKRDFRSDTAMQRLSAYLEKIVDLDRDYHVRRGLVMGSAPNGVGVGSSNTSPAFTTPVLVSIRTLSVELRGQAVATRSPLSTLIERTRVDADAYIEVLLEFSRRLHADIIHRQDSFVAVLPALRRVKGLRELASQKAEAHQVFARSLQRLALEAELFEALLTVDYKATLLAGIDAFAELQRAEHLLARYVQRSGPCLATPSAFNSAVGADALRGLGGSASSLHSLACVPNKNFGTSASLVSQQPPLGASLTSTMISGRLSCVELPDSGGGLSVLESWYEWFCSHCTGRLLLLCGAGLAAAAHLGARQIVEPWVGQASSAGVWNRGGSSLGSSDSGTPLVARPSTEQSTCTTEIPPGRLRTPALDPPVLAPQRAESHACTYLSDLRSLASLPGVAFVGVFANARQLPHLQDPHCISAIDPGKVMKNDSVSAGMEDSAWLLAPVTAPSPHNLTYSEASVLEPMWALAFAAAEIQGGEQPRVLCGLDALRQCRHASEWRQLRRDLSNACRARHTPHTPAPSVTSYQPRSPPRPDVSAAATPLPVGLRKRNYLQRTIERNSMSSAVLGEGSGEQFPDLSRARGAGSNPNLPGPTDLDMAMHVAHASSACEPATVHADADSPLVKPRASSWSGPGAPGHEAILSHVVNSVDRVLVSDHVTSPQGPAGLMASGVADASAVPFQCFVAPLDLGWFPAPLFLGLVAQDRPSTALPSSFVGSTALTSTTVNSGVSWLPRGLGCMLPATVEDRGGEESSRKRMWSRMKAWASFQSYTPEERPAVEDPRARLEAECARFAENASGRALRGGLLFPPAVEGRPEPTRSSLSVPQDISASSHRADFKRTQSSGAMIGARHDSM